MIRMLREVQVNNDHAALPRREGPPILWIMALLLAFPSVSGENGTKKCHDPISCDSGKAEQVVPENGRR